jgi:hypothetical protein
MAAERSIKVIFFDVRDTPGEANRPGHLEPCGSSPEAPLSTAAAEVKLEIGVVAGPPDDPTTEEGIRRICNAVLSENDEGGRGPRPT